MSITQRGRHAYGQKVTCCAGVFVQFLCVTGSSIVVLGGTQILATDFAAAPFAMSLQVRPLVVLRN